MTTMTNTNDDNNPSRGELGVTGASAATADANSASAATADASRGARGSSSVTSEEDSLDLRDFCRSPLLTEDSLRRRLSSLDNGNGAVDFPHDMNIILFDVCANEHVTLGIAQCVLEYLPGSVEARTSTGTTPLHVVCRNKNVTLDIVRCLVKEYSDALSLQDENGMSPLFYLCMNNELNDSAAVEVLDLLLEECPESAKQSCTVGFLPIWYAIRRRSPDFCCKLMAAFPGGIHHEYESKPILWYLLASSDVDGNKALALMKKLIGNHLDLIRRFRWNGASPLHFVAGAKIPRSAELCGLLIEALPELVNTFRLPDPDEGSVGLLQPFHIACVVGNLPVVKCILDMYPNAIFGQTSLTGIFPIHYAVAALDPDEAITPEDVIEMIRFLLTVDAMVASQTYSEANGRAMTPLREACFFTNESNSSAGLEVIKLLYDADPEAIHVLAGELGEFATEIADFLHLQLRYARIARDPELVTTPDEDGNLPIHLALYARAALGTIKLLVDANISTLLTPTHNNGNTLLHEACRLGEYGVIEMLMTRYPTEQVHTQNSLGGLPIQVLIESDTNEPESAEHLSSIFLLLRVSPADLMSGTDLGSE